MPTTLVLALVLALAPAAGNRAWQDGVLKDVSRLNSRAEIVEPEFATGTGDRRIKYTVTYEYNIDTADKFYVARIQVTEQGSITPVAVPPLDLDTNSHLTFAIDNRTLYIKDKQGKEHKLSLVEKGLLKDKPATPGRTPR